MLLVVFPQIGKGFIHNLGLTGNRFRTGCSVHLAEHLDDELDDIGADDIDVPFLAAGELQIDLIEQLAEYIVAGSGDMHIRADLLSGKERVEQKG